MTDCPCMNCTNRKIDCHALCEKYIEWYNKIQTLKGKSSYEAYDLLEKKREKFLYKRVRRY